MRNDVSKNYYKGWDAFESCIEDELFAFYGMHYSAHCSCTARPAYQRQDERDYHVGGTGVHAAIKEGTQEENKIEAWY